MYHEVDVLNSEDMYLALEQKVLPTDLILCREKKKMSSDTHGEFKLAQKLRNHGDSFQFRSV